MKNVRLTTAEAAKYLGLPISRALAILHASNIPHESMGNRGPFLWDAAIVKRLADSLIELSKIEKK